MTSSASRTHSVSRVRQGLGQGNSKERDHGCDGHAAVDADDPGGGVAAPPVGLLSVIVPAFNEERTIATALERVLALPVAAIEIVVVDDGSTDETGGIAREIAARDPRVMVLRHPENVGKGGAIRTALPHVRGALVVIQDVLCPERPPGRHPPGGRETRRRAGSL